MNIDAIRSESEKFTLEQMRRVYQTQFRLLKGALNALKSGRTQVYADLMTVAQELDGGNAGAGIKDLIRMAKSQDFKGSAAYELELAIEETIENYDLSPGEIEKLNSLRRDLQARRASSPNSPQVIAGNIER